MTSWRPRSTASQRVLASLSFSITSTAFWVVNNVSWLSQQVVALVLKHAVWWTLSLYNSNLYSCVPTERGLCTKQSRAMKCRERTEPTKHFLKFRKNHRRSRISRRSLWSQKSEIEVINGFHFFWCDRSYQTNLSCLSWGPVNLRFALLESKDIVLSLKR